MGRHSKYGNRKVKVNGIDFDSMKEGKRYQELLLLEKAGEISDLQLQVKYVLIPAYREPDTIGKNGGVHKGKLIERECSYIADFSYKTADGTQVVEDVKGFRHSKAYDIFAIKRKLMLHVHGIRIKEI